MPEGLKLTAQDLNDMLSTMGSHNFSGYVRMDLSDSQHGYVFVSRGQLIRAFLCKEAEDTRLYTPERMFAKAGDQGVACASYVLSPQMVGVLAYAFGFESAHDWKTAFQQEKQTGLAWFGDRAVLFGKGEALQESLAQEYGEVACGRECLHKLLAEGQARQVLCQPQAGLEQRAKRLHQDLERMREVRLKSVSGFFATKDALKVEAELAQEWGQKGTFMLVVENLEGRRVGMLKASAGSKKPHVMEIPLKIMQEWGLAEDQAVMVYPQGD